MASKKNAYQEKSKPVYQVLYILAIAALLFLLVVMYRNWQNKRRQYDVLVREASITETDYDIETRKLLNNEQPEDQTGEDIPQG